jgi:hypothetical protein
MSVDRKCVPVRKALLKEAGKTLRKTDRCYTSCRNPLCVNPDHIQILHVKQLMSKLADLSHLSGGTVRAQKIANSRRVKSRLTMDIIRQIRSEERTAPQAAHEYGISCSYYNRIRRNEVWKDTANPFLRLAA